VNVNGHPFIVSPHRRTARLVPQPFEYGGFGESFAIDDAGHVLLESGYLAQGIDKPFEHVVQSPAEQRKWRTNDFGEELYVDTPVTAFFWGGRGIIVTQFPEVSLHVIDLERS